MALGRRTVSQQPLSDSGKVAVLRQLVEIGREVIDRQAELVFPWMPPLKDPEFLARNVLLWSIMNRGARVETVNKALEQLFAQLGPDLYIKPEILFSCFDELSERLFSLGYRIRYVGIQVKSEETLLARFASYSFFIQRLKDEANSLLRYLSSFNSPSECEEQMSKQHLLGTMTRKAIRLFLGFVGHPLLGKRLSIVNDGWPKWGSEMFLVPVDGHVGKVFARTGLLAKVRAENDKVVAFEMDKAINALVKGFSKLIQDPFLINVGAYSIGQFCCKDEKPTCELKGCPSTNCPYTQSCPKNCPIENIGCKRHTHWWAMKARKLE